MSRATAAISLTYKKEAREMNGVSGSSPVYIYIYIYKKSARLPSFPLAVTIC